MFERELRTLSHVPRWAIVRTIQRQSVAEHSYYVAIYADQIAELIEWQGSRRNLMRLAMFHDMDEILSGDIASPAKAVLNCAEYRTWSSKLMSGRFSYFEEWFQSEPGRVKEALTILHVADWLEGVLFLCDEEFLGNKNVRDVRCHCEERLFEAIKLLPATMEDVIKFNGLISKSIFSHLAKCDALTVKHSKDDVKDYMQNSLFECEESE